MAICFLPEVPLLVPLYFLIGGLSLGSWACWLGLAGCSGSPVDPPASASLALALHVCPTTSAIYVSSVLAQNRPSLKH